MLPGACPGTHRAADSGDGDPCRRESDFNPDVHWQAADGCLVTTFKIYHGTHVGEFLGIAPTGRKIQFEAVDVMRVVDGKIVEHLGRGKPLLLRAAARGLPATGQSI
jgi:hypothetical protein